MNLIKNNIVITQDLNLATKAYGPNMSTIKVKTTKNKPTQVANYMIKILDKLLEVQQDVVLSIDRVVVNSLNDFTSIFHEIYYRTAQYVQQPVAEIYRKLMDEKKIDNRYRIR